MLTSRSLLILVCSAVLTLALATAGPAAAKRPCPATTKSGKKISVTSQVYCWIKVARTARKLSVYKKNGKLAKVARKHSAVMQAKNIFTHEIGGSAFDRIRASGYFKGSHSFGSGETIQWARNAHDAVNAWFREPFHRSILLSTSLREYGVGVVKGAPHPGKSGGYTVTADYGRR
jgi:uncharacterized protein YkwD